MQVRKRLLSSLFPSILMATIFVTAHVIPPAGPWYVLRVVLGIIGVFIIPGYVISEAVLKEKLERLPFLVPIFGLLYQLGIILFMYAAEPLLSLVPMVFSDAFISISFVSLAGLSFLKSPGARFTTSTRGLIRQNLPIVILLVVGLLPRLVLMGDTSTPATDGALYLSQARSAVLTGTFQAAVSNDSPVISNWTSLGLSTHPFAVFGLVLFFMIGDVSYLSGKLMAITASLSIIVVAYTLAQRLHSTAAGCVAGLIVALHPWLMFWSVVLYGPEILSGLWLLFFFLLLAISDDPPTTTVPLILCLASVAVALLGTDYPSFWSLFLALPLVLRYLGPWREKNGIFAASTLIVVLSLPFAYYAGRPDFYILTELPSFFWGVAFVPPVVCTLIYPSGKITPFGREILLFFTALNVGLQTLMAKAYFLVQTSQTQLLSIGTSGLLESNQWYSRLRTVGIEKLLWTQLDFWQLLMVSSGATLFFMGLASFFLNIRRKQRSPFVVAMTAGSLFYSLGAIGREFFEPQWWNYRLVIGFVPILAVLVSFCANLPRMLGRLHVGRVLGSAVPSLFIVLVVMLPMSPLYGQATQDMTQFDAQRFWGPVANWALSTPSDSRFLVYDPYTWNWLSNRPAIALTRAQDIVGLETVTQAIKQYKADYVILDSSNTRTHNLLKTYFSTSAAAPPGFLLAFSNTVDGLTISVYDVRKIGLLGPVHTTTATLIEDTEVYEGTPGTTYGNLTVLAVGWGSDLSEARIYLKFDTVEVPRNALVLGYQLTFFVPYSYVSRPVDSPLGIEALLVDNNWTESGLTWLSQPVLVGTGGATVNLSATFHGNVTLYFNGPFNPQGFISVAIYPKDTASLFRYATIFSKENSNPYPNSSLPSLVVIYSAI